MPVVKLAFFLMILFVTFLLGVSGCSSTFYGKSYSSKKCFNLLKGTVVEDGDIELRYSESGRFSLPDQIKESSMYFFRYRKIEKNENTFEFPIYISQVSAAGSCRTIVVGKFFASSNAGQTSDDSTYYNRELDKGIGLLFAKYEQTFNSDNEFISIFKNDNELIEWFNGKKY